MKIYFANVAIQIGDDQRIAEAARHRNQARNGLLNRARLYFLFFLFVILIGEKRVSECIVHRHSLFRKKSVTLEYGRLDVDARQELANRCDLEEPILARLASQHWHHVVRERVYACDIWLETYS